MLGLLKLVFMFITPFAADGTAMDGYFSDLLRADRDRHARNATTMEHYLEMQYVGSKEFRDATAGRIILEAGSGRTRAETNSPTQTAAQNQA